MSVSYSRSCKTTGKLIFSFSYDCTREIIAVKMVQSALKSMHEKSQNQTVKSPHWLLSSAAARSYPVPRPGRYGRYGYPDRIRIRIRPGKTLKLHFPEGYGMSATSTTKLESSWSRWVTMVLQHGCGTRASTCHLIRWVLGVRSAVVLHDLEYDTLIYIYVIILKLSHKLSIQLYTC